MNLTLKTTSGKILSTRTSSKEYAWAVVRWSFRKASSKTACLGITNLSNSTGSAMRAADKQTRYSNVAEAFAKGSERPYLVVPIVDGIVHITDEDVLRLTQNAVNTYAEWHATCAA